MILSILSSFQPTSSTKASATLITHGISPFALFSGKIFLEKNSQTKYFTSTGEIPISNGIDEYGIDNNIDSDLRVILRKLVKKDSTTKIRVKPKKRRKIFKFKSFFFPKAFDELRDYCEANESDEKIRTILPFFVSHYRKWSTVRIQHFFFLF